MDLNRFNRKRTNRLYLYILLLVACSFLSFLLGVVTLRNGTLRKLYDIYDAAIALNENVPTFYSAEITDTLNIQLSKKNYNRIVKLRSDSFLAPKNYLNYGWQWIGERPWQSANFSVGQDTFSKAKVKLIGMNSDHFREGKNWSIRVKLKDDVYYKGYQKFNLLNPYSRGFFIDQIYNKIYQQQGGLYLNQIPVYTKLENNLIPQVLEPFFSKELLESQLRRDYLILVADSIDKYGGAHLKVVHPSNNIATLSKRQQDVFRFYDSVYAKGKLIYYFNELNYAFLTAVALCTGGQTHHFVGGNLYLYVDPITGDLKPFLREISSVEKGDLAFDYASLKLSFYSQNNLNEYARKSTVFNQKVDEFVTLIQSLNIEKLIQGDEALSIFISYINKNYPWAFVYKKRLRAKLTGLQKPTITSTAAKRINIFSESVFLRDTSIVYKSTDSVLFKKGARVILINSTIIFSGLNINYGDGFQSLVFEGDSLSSLVFDNSRISLTNTRFKGFGNHLGMLAKNRDITGAVTFANSNVRLSNVDFSNNYSGDDLVNFYHCKVEINNSSFHNAKADGIDFDFTSGQLINSRVFKCGNDGLDLGGSSLNIKNTSVSLCGDKGISVGEASINVSLDSVRLVSNEIGISLKDASIISVNRIKFEANKVDFVGYGKKAQYSHSVLSKSDIDFTKISSLIEPDVLLPSGVSVSRTERVVDLMYGKKYGRKSIR